MALTDLQRLARPDITDYFWVVGGSTTQVYSSKAKAFMPVTAQVYQDWIAAGNLASPIGTNQELFDYLANAGVPLPAGENASDTVKQQIVARIDPVILRIMFNHENRIRVLAGQQSVTQQQFLAAIANLL